MGDRVIRSGFRFHGGPTRFGKTAAEIPGVVGGPRALKLRLGLKHTRHSYREAVKRACGRAGIPAWSPRQRRHTRATLIRQAYGLEAAKAVLGHADTKITEIYAERDLGLAMRIMREIG